MEFHGTKGCYLGQEITARMYYRKITKKISHVKINFESFVEEKVLLDNKVVGFMTSNDNKNGLAYISSDILEDSNNKILRCGDSTVIVSEPWWSKNVNP